MKPFITITSRLEQPEFICQLIERLACTHKDIGYGSFKSIGQWQPVETSTNDIYAGCVVEMFMHKEQINIPYMTNFLFTCLKGSDGIYRLEWGSSLS